MKLWLLRHARVSLDAGLCYGVSDVPADVGLSQQAAECAAKLLPPGLPVRVSGMGRAHQLASALYLLRPDLQLPVLDPRLNEMDFGCWELQRWDDIPRSAFDDWMADFANHRFGGSESTQGVIDRVANVIDELRHQSVAEAVWVTHAGVIRAANFLATHGHIRIADVSQWPIDAPAQGGHQVLDC